MMQSLIQTNFATVTIVLFMFVFLMLDHFSDKRVVRTFLMIAANVLILVFLDGMDCIFQEQPTPASNRVLVAYLGYVFRPVMLYLIFILIYNASYRRKILFGIPIVLNALILSTAFFSKLSFYYSADNQFMRGPFAYTTHIVSLFYLISLIYITSRRSKSASIMDSSIAIVVLMLAVVAVFLEAAYDYDGLVSATAAVSMIFYYLYLNTRQFRRDPLTNVYNRRCFYVDAEKNLHAISAVISMDLNNLKTINDTEGHEAGDKAICGIVNCANKVLVRGSTLYRTGGDEFMILCFRQSKESISYMLRELNDEIEKSPYQCAIGVAYAEEGGDFNELCTLADAKMYANKSYLKSLQQSEQAGA